jgi:hypothetical protein
MATNGNGEMAKTSTVFTIRAARAAELESPILARHVGRGRDELFAASLQYTHE